MECMSGIVRYIVNIIANDIESDRKRSNCWSRIMAIWVIMANRSNCDPGVSLSFVGMGEFKLFK